MFQGTKHIAEDKYFEYLQKAGASNVNGSTVAGPHQLLRGRPLEPARAGAVAGERPDGVPARPPGFKETLDNQRDVVKNERRQRTENRPAGLVSQVLLEALYPPDHPYYHEVIGSMEDLSAASVEDVKGFFRTYYAPGNATLTIAGDFDRAKTKELVEQYFGPIPAGPPVARRPAPTVRLTAPKRIAMEAKIQQPQLYVSYPSPANFAPGDRELDLLANVLGNGKSSRLYKRLVYELKIAQSVSASQQSQLLASDFEITASPMPGHTLDEILAVIDEEIAGAPGQAGRRRRARSRQEPDRVGDRAQPRRRCWPAPSGCSPTTICSVTRDSWPRTCAATARSTRPRIQRVRPGGPRQGRPGGRHRRSRTPRRRSWGG